ncbi:MAG TPA: pyruvate kinase alpha/beta domain-containing protein, partial [Saliniramus sp.]|nr:pyruvate kinase alpha/beta domain-containing protein [Saliniramus sp.]
DTARRISLVWGVHAIVTRDANNADDMTFRACQFAVRAGLATVGARIIVIAGVPFGTPGATNMIRIAFVTQEHAAVA